MTDSNLIDDLSGELFQASRNLETIPMISERYPEFTIDDAYAVSLGILKRRMASGEKVIGKKIGLTAKPIQEMLGIDEPDFGFLTDAMEVSADEPLEISDHMMTPMIEAETGFILKDSLPNKGVTPEQVLDATDYITPCFELVDTRFNTQQIKIVDTVADNASSALFVLGEEQADPRELDLVGMECVVFRNGEQILEGKGAAVMGSPLNSLAWLANCLGKYGVTLDAGDIVLPGSLVPFAPIAPGDFFEARFSGLGSVRASFN